MNLNFPQKWWSTARGALLRCWSVLGRSVVAVGVAAGALLVAAGCGPTWLTARALSASSALSQAEHAGAAEVAPYEYWSARQYLEKSAEEANEGNYQDAVRFAERAQALSEEAIELTRTRQRQAVEPTP